LVAEPDWHYNIYIDSMQDGTSQFNCPSDQFSKQIVVSF